MGAESEALLRLSIFVGVFAVLAALEAVWPRRTSSLGRVKRWGTNVGLSALNTMLLRLSFFVVPALSVLAALYGEARGWGLLPALGVPALAAAIVGFVALDLAVYVQHVAFHAVPFLWRIHRVHHADAEVDVSTGIRFHPVEIVISQAWKIAVVLALGVPALAVLGFEIALNATSMFSHSNLRLSAGVDSVLRRVVVTPDMHRVHHSTASDEANSNFGFNLSIWDRLFATYRAAPDLDHATMPLGLSSYRGDEPRRLLWLLQFPFVRGPVQ
jgi:sterol desaturase/sphingolipid hydroxylase (fatty acid hydroxylase superfamily)